MKYSTHAYNSLREFFSKNRDKAFGAEELMDILGISQSTLYRLLSQMIDDGEIKKIPSRKREYVYQYVEKEHCPMHMHIRCVKCGQIEHIDDALSAEIEQKIKESSGYEALNSTLFDGICSQCRGKK